MSYIHIFLYLLIFFLYRFLHFSGTWNTVNFLFRHFAHYHNYSVSNYTAGQVNTDYIYKRTSLEEKIFFFLQMLFCKMTALKNDSILLKKKKKNLITFIRCQSNEPDVILRNQNLYQSLACHSLYFVLNRVELSF